MKKKLSLLAALCTLALALSSCALLTPQSQETTSGPVVETTRQPDEPGGDLERFYQQDVTWSDCGLFMMQCAMIEVPLDWDNPAGDVIELALTRVQSSSADRIGSIVLNPGGPGASGIDLPIYFTMGMGTAELGNAYDYVGFDPRGVGESSAVYCYDDAEMDRLMLEDFDASDDDELAYALQQTVDYGQACLEGTGELLANVDTQSAARDLDVIRAILGERQLNYLGFSYGTLLGATYANLYPERVGRMVLDGAIDPTLTADESARDQVLGFEQALRSFVEDCQTSARCVLTGDVDEGMAQIAQLINDAGVSPLPSGTDTAVNSTVALYGVFGALYSQYTWAELRTALDQAISDRDGSGLMLLANSYLGRSDGGFYDSNMFQAFRAINCLDERQSDAIADMRAESVELQELAPVFGQFFGYGGTSCHQWPAPLVDPITDWSAAGSGPILVVGTTGDPATPYSGAVALADTLESGVLLTYEGEGHTAYGSANECLHSAVDDYLIRGTLPTGDATC